ncbi:hypothetical protein JYT31_01450 [Beggiatoa alba]|nr:hypothetical protein [Beggiatoa alba]
MNDWFKDQAWKSKWFEWFHVIYATIVVAGGIVTIFPDKPELRELIILIAFCSYSGILLIFLVLFTFKFSRKARYSEATKCLHSALHSARDAYHYLDWCKSESHDEVSFDKERLCRYMTATLTSVSAAFTLVTGVNCRTSIKILGQTADNQLYVSTLARDAIAKTASEDRDRIEGEKHLVSANTDFHLITEGHLNYFCDSNLPKYPNYANSSLGNNGVQKGQPWKLPYKSSIVWPIRYVYTKNETEASTTKDTNEDLFGFLTVDSSSVNAFIEKYDVEMGAALADTLFPLLNAYAVFMARN